MLGGLRERIDRRTVDALGLALLVTSLPYWEVLTGRRSAMFGDVNDLTVPQYMEVWQAIRDGDRPWWTPGVFGGRSMVGAGQYAVFYPFNALFGFLEPVTAYRWWFFLHLWVGCAGAFTWAWRRWDSRLSAVVSAFAYSGSGFAVLHLVHSPFVIGVAWLPWVLCGVDLVRERWSVPRAALVALPLALIAFGGQPQLLWFAVAFVSVYVVGLSVFDRREGLGRVALAGALGIGVAAVQLLPQWQFSRTSFRPSLSMDGAFEHAAAPRHLLTLVFPWLFGGSGQDPVFSAPWTGGDVQHEVAMFAGASILALAVTAVVLRRRDAVVRALLAVSALAVLMAIGRSTPFGRLFYDVLPLARSFRAWGRTIFLLNLAVAMLAGLGLRELRKAPEPALRWVAGAAGGLAVVALAIPHVGSLQDHLARGSYGLLARGLPVVLLLAVAGAIAVMVLHPRAGAVAVVAVCALEVMAFTYPAEWRQQSAPIANLHEYYDEDRPPSFGEPLDAPGGIDRWASDTYGFRMVSLVKDITGLNGFDPLLQKDWADTVGGFAYDGYPTRPDLWEPGWLDDVLRVTTLVLGPGTTPTDPSWQRVGQVPGSDMVRWEREPRLPEAYLVGAVEEAPLPEIQDALRDADAPLADQAYVEDEADGLDELDEPGRSGTVRSVDVLGSGRVEVDADRPSLLVLAHSWEDGWHATVDGKGADVLRTNGLVLGVVVPAGEHTVELHFTPPGLKPGGALSVLSLVGLFGGTAALARVRRRREA